MVTILHTADVHLDRAYAGAGMTSSIASARRQELREGFRRFIDLALELRADAVTIGGDLYEHERSTLDTGKFLRAQFERVAPTPVFISPGNHDYYAPDSLYRRVTWPTNVTIFTEPRLQPASLADGLTIWSAGHDAPDLRQNLLDGFRAPADGTHILLFHGSDISNVPEGKPAHCPFRPEDIHRTGAAFALLGHYHAARLTDRFAYPGSPEPLDFSEAGAHGVLRLDVDGPSVTAQLVENGTVRYVTHRLDVAGIDSSDGLRSAILAHADPRAITRIILEGDLTPETDLNISALYNTCAEGFQYLDLLDRTRPAWSLDELAEESTTKGAFVRLMRAKIAALPPDDAETAQLALTLGLQAFERKEVTIG
jgi:DNA repair exonuclease SbcCD nuclease subunit